MLSFFFLFQCDVDRGQGKETNIFNLKFFHRNIYQYVQIFIKYLENVKLSYFNEEQSYIEYLHIIRLLDFVIRGVKIRIMGWGGGVGLKIYVKI